MNKTQVAREVAATLHTAEDALETALVAARAALVRLQAAKGELGLTGTFGDAAIADVARTVTTLEAAREQIFSGHAEAHTVMKLTNIRGVASTMIPPLSLPESVVSAA